MKNFKEINRTFTVKKTKFLQRVLWLMIPLLTIFATNVWADAVFTPSSRNAGTLTGAPTGAAATYYNSYNNANQITNGNTATLTLSGFDGCTITGVTLRLKKSSGTKTAGVTASANGSQFINQTVASNSLSTSYQNFAMTLSTNPLIGAGKTIQIVITPSASSVYVESFTITYTARSKYTVLFSTGTGNPSVASRTETNAGDGITLPSTSDLTPTCSGDGWYLLGWTTSAYGSSSTTTAPTTTFAGLAGATYIPPANNTTLYAVYAKVTGAATAQSLVGAYASHTGWTISDGICGSSYWILCDGQSITSPIMIDLSSITSIVISTRTYGGASYKTTVVKTDGGTSVGSVNADGTSFDNKTISSPSISGCGSLVFTSSTTTAANGPGINQITINYTATPKIYWHSPTCCTPLASISGSFSFSSTSQTGTTANWSWTGATTGISKNILKVYKESDNSLVKTIDNISASATSQAITGLDPCTQYYVKLTTVSSGGGYCDGVADQTGASHVTFTTGSYTYTITKNNVSLKGGESEAANSCDDFLAEYVANSGYTLPATITVTGASSYEWDDGVLAIEKENVTGNVTVTITGVAASNFINGETVFIQAESSSAWNDNACVKAWFNNSGAGGAAQTTYWLFDATGGDAGKKVYATIVPSTGTLNQVQLQRFASNCSTWWNSNGDLTKAASSGSNAFRSYGGAENNVAWNPGSVTLDLMGDPNSWASTLGTLTDQGNGVWSTTYNNYAPANAAGESQEFKLACNYNGWVATNNGENETLSGMHVGSTYNITATLDIKDHTLTMSKTYVKGTVHFNMNGHGSAISDLTNVAAGSKISAPSAPTETGWTFGGWYKEAGCTNEWNFGSDVVNETMTLYAKWTIKTTTLSFDQNGGTGGQTTTKTATYGSAMPTPIICPTRTGYTFGGYYESSGGTGNQYYTNTGTSARNWDKENATWTLYAKWTANTYEVTLDREGATTGSTSVTMTYNSSSHTAITAPTRDGYVFGGWYTGEGGTGTQVMDASGALQANVAGYTGAGGIWTKDATCTLYAKWEAAKVFTLATSGTTLVDGDEIVLMNTGSTYAMSTTQESDYRGYTNTGISVSGTTLSVYANSDAQIIFLEESGSYLLFNVGGYNYLCGNNNLKTKDITQEEIAGDCEWSYSIDASSNANIYSNGTHANKYLQYNSGSPRFKCYANGNQQKVKIYCHHISTPFVRYNPETLQTFQYAVGYGPSLAQALHIKGYNLTGNLTVTCPSGYELSETSNASDFGTSNLTLTRSSNKVNATIYIRLAAGKSVGSYDTNLAISGGGITTTNVPLVGLVTAADGTGEMYVALRDVSDLFPDDEMVLLNDTGTWIMNNTNLSGNNQRASNSGFIYKGTTVYVTDSYSKVQKITTEESSVANRWLLKAGTKYLYAASASGNQLKTAATKTTATSSHNGEWLIETNATGIATIHAPESSMRDTINFNYAAGSDYRLFSCYNRFLNRKHGGTALYYRTIPNIWCQPSSLTGFSVDYGAGASAAQTFIVQGKNLGENIVTLTAPAGYEISKTSSSTGYATELTLTPTNGKITSTTIWVRIEAGNEAGEYNGHIEVTATGATTRYVELEGVVNPVPNITLATTSSTLLVTSRNGINIMATNTLTLNISGAVPGQAVSFTAAGLKFYKNDGTHYVELTGGNALTAPVTNQVVYVSYNPTTTGTGAITSPDIQVSCNGTTETFSNKIKVRNLPDAVAIVAHTGDSWQALPANMSGAQNPGPVVVSVASVDGILKASGASTLAYKLWPVKTTNGSGDRFGTYSSPSALYADRVRFAGNSDKGLWSNDNTSTNTINNNAAITTVGADVTTGYEWIITTTESDGQFVYNLTSTHGSNTNDLRFWLAAAGGAKWGTYANGIRNLYILPLTEITEADITVMEWGTNKIAVSYPNRASCTAMTAKIGTGSPAAVTINSIGGDIYELTGVGDLQGNPAKTLVLAATEGGAKQKIVAIPYIITTDGVAEATIRSAVGDAAEVTDVVIRSGGKLTTGTASGAFKDLYIYPGGKADISLNISLKNVYLRGGYSWLGGSYALPQLNVASGKSISGIGATGNGVFYDLYLDNSIYYMMALPKTVALSAVTNEIGTSAFDAWIKEYSGEGRTLSPKVSGWSYVSGANIERGKGYEIAIKPRISGRPYGILRFPLLKSTAWSDEAACTPSVKGWGYADDNVTANNKGWNCLGNPFLTAYNNTATPGSTPSGLVQTKTLVHHPGDPWNGTWDWSESTVKYFTIPRYTEYEYDDVRAYPYKLDAFHPFFIQATGDGTVSFTASNKALKAPSRYAAKMEREVIVDFALKDTDGKKDEAGLTIGNQYSEAFDMDDKEKTIQNGNATMKVYTIVGEYRVAYNALPETAAAQPIPVGYIAPQAGSYKFALVDGADYTEVEHLWLTDYEMSSVIDLLDEQFYEFTTAAGQIDNRFAINAILKPEQPQTPTGMEETEETSAPVKFLYHDQLYIMRGGVIYDATGKRVSIINK